MEPPDDPGGGEVPGVGYNVTISNESGMETDGSVKSSSGARKRRATVNKHCSKCHKKSRNRRRNEGKEIKPNECDCIPLFNNNTNTQSITPPQFTDSQLNSNQSNQYKKPESVARLTYQASDAAPYVVHVQKIQQTSNDNVTVHPIAFGRFLKRHSIHNIVNGSLKRIGRNRLSLSFNNYQDANSFLNSPALQSAEYKVFIPTFTVTRMGVVRGIPAEWSDEEVMENINLPVGCGPILKVRRMRRRIITSNGTEFKATETVVLTFDGQILPKRIFICYTALPVDLYIFPTIQCYNCCRFGHVKALCRSKPKCFKCGQDHTADQCSILEEDAHCCLCQGSHFATSKRCLEFERQKAIKETMAKSCISYAEASKIHAPISKISYADALLSSSNVGASTISTPRYEQPHKQPLSNSYKKTVFLKPKSVPELSKGYDKKTQQELIKDYDMPSPRNGIALNSNNHNELTLQSIADLIKILINTLSQSNILPPSNAAPLIDTIVNLPNYINNGQASQSSTVEL